MVAVCPAEGGGEAAHTCSEACRKAGTPLQSRSEGRGMGECARDPVEQRGRALGAGRMLQGREALGPALAPEVGVVLGKGSGRALNWNAKAEGSIQER